MMKRFVLLLPLLLIPPPVQADTCVRLVKAQGREILVNTCDSCRTAKVERDRPGSATGVPSMREYLIPAGGRQPLTFRGAGRTRVMSSLACPARGAKKAPGELGPDGKVCVQIGDQPGIGRILVNTCKECRLVTLQRTGRGGVSKRAQSALAARSFLAVDTANGTTSTIIQDAPCAKQ